MLLLEPCRTSCRLVLGSQPVINVLAEGGISQHALELVSRDRLQDDPRILSEVPQYRIERAPQSIGGMIPRPMHIQGEFRQGIEPFDLHKICHLFRIANIFRWFHLSVVPASPVTRGCLRRTLARNSSVRSSHTRAKRFHIFMQQPALPYC